MNDLIMKEFERHQKQRTLRPLYEWVLVEAIKIETDKYILAITANL